MKWLCAPWYRSLALVLEPLGSLCSLGSSQYIASSYKPCLLLVFLLMFLIGFIISFLQLIDYCIPSGAAGQEES